MDERVAVEDFRAGQCDGVVATAFRTRQFNAVAGSIDSIGSTTIVKDGKIDIKASYDVVKKVIEVFATPQAGKLMVEGNYEVGASSPRCGILSCAIARSTRLKVCRARRLPRSTMTRLRV